jgi:uncharacterized protein (TIGR03085 family)
MSEGTSGRQEQPKPGGIAQRERRRLCAELRRVGPDGPTLCEGWQARDLAAHLFVRERRPLAAVGIAVAPLASRTRRAMENVLAKEGFEGVVRRVEEGPPRLLRPLDEQINVVEMFVHLEDVRRAGGEVAPRDDAELEVALRAALRRGTGLLTRSLRGVGLRVVFPDGTELQARTGRPEAVLEGPAGEVLLYLFGRRAVARVRLGGDPDAQRVLETARLGA